MIKFFICDVLSMTSKKLLLTVCIVSGKAFAKKKLFSIVSAKMFFGQKSCGYDCYTSYRVSLPFYMKFPAADHKRTLLRYFF